MTKIKGSCVLITGGASGIGKIMGRIALEKGARQLIIWDINEAGIATTIIWAIFSFIVIFERIFSALSSSLAA